jgi:hypothetical protein
MLRFLFNAIIVAAIFLGCSKKDDPVSPQENEKEVNIELTLDFLKAFGSDESEIGKAIQQTVDGGYIIAGDFKLFPSFVLLIRTDVQGNELWSKTYGEGKINSIQITADGAFILTGEVAETGSSYGNDILLMKVDASGNELWRKTYNNNTFESGSCVQQTPDGGYIITSNELNIIKTDNQGNIQWNREVRYTGAAKWSHIEVTSDGGFIVTGSNNNDVLLTKLSQAGDELWYRKFNDLRENWGSYVKQTKDGGYIIVGDTHVNLNVSPWRGDIYLIRTDGNGNKFWQKIFSTNQFDDGCAVEETSDGGFLVVGDTKGFGQGDFSDIWIIKTNELGETQISKTFGRDRDDACYGMQKARDGRFVITGFSRATTGSSNDMLLMKVTLK